MFTLFFLGDIYNIVDNFYNIVDNIYNIVDKFYNIVDNLNTKTSDVYEFIPIEKNGLTTFFSDCNSINNINSFSNELNLPLKCKNRDKCKKIKMSTFQIYTDMFHLS
jgi:hypothetical protein